MMIHPGDKVYGGMIIGEHNRDNDLEVNVLKGQKADECPRLRLGRRRAPDAAAPDDARKRSLAYIADDELVEVTPASIRLRKVHLDPHERKRAAKAAAAV